MKKEYKRPIAKISNFECNGFMDTFSLPTTGEVEDPSFGQANEIGGWDEDNEVNCIGIWEDEYSTKKNKYPSIWDTF